MFDVALALWALAAVAFIGSAFLGVLWRLAVHQAMGDPISWGFRREFAIRDRIAGDVRAWRDLFAVNEPTDGPGAAYHRWEKRLKIVAVTAVAAFVIELVVTAASRI